MKKIIKKNFFFHRTDGQTDTRSTQSYSSEPHKTLHNTKIHFFNTWILTLDF